MHLTHRSDIVDYCLSRPGAWLDSPWGHDDTVAKVGDESYALVVAALPKSKRP